jgi:chemotaxis protein methyltransferase CheR
MNRAVAELARMIEEASGFVVSERSYGQLAAIANEQIASLKLADIEEYLDLLSARSDSPEWRHLLARITVKESYMYRGRSQIDALKSVILEELAAIRTNRRLRVWCAGCARGEEAVTLAIVISSHPVVGTWDWSILATDVDEQALDEARLGRYGERAVAAVPSDILASRFVRRGDRYEIDPRLLGRIAYRRVNLVDRGAVVGEGPFDLIFLRNVLIYFRPELQRRVVKTVEQALAPDGVLFLGPSESLLPLDASLLARDLGSCFCYRWPPQKAAPRPGIGITPRVQSGFRDAAGGGVEGVIPPRSSPDGLTDGATPEERIGRVVNAVAAGDSASAHRLALALRHEFPEIPVVHALVGAVAARTSDHRAAVLAYRAALYLDPAAPEIRFLLATALEADGRADRARREYRSVLASLSAVQAAPSPWFRALGVPERDQLVIVCRKKLITMNI